MPDDTKKHRFLSDFYDSVFQRSYSDLAELDNLVRFRYLGKLRLDGILSHTIVLLDTQVLDGAFFLDPRNDPGSLLDQLSRGSVLGSPIEIRARSPLLADALLMFVKEPNKPLLKQFSFSTIHKPSERSSAFEVLGNTKSETVSDWRAILSVFRSAGVEESNVDSLEAAWSRWIELQEKGLVTVIEWERERGFPREFYAGSENEFLAGFKSDEVKREAKWVYSSLDKRSLIDVHLEQLRNNWGDENVAELRILEAKFHRVYDAAAAWQHRCGTFEASISTFVELMDTKDRSTLETYDFETKLETVLTLNNIDRLFLYKLGTMPAGIYQELCWSRSEDLAQWWYGREIDSLRRAIDPIVDKITKSEGPQDGFKDDNIVADLIKIFTDAVKELIPIPPIKAIYTFFSKSYDFIIKYYSGKSKDPREKLIQRIIDFAIERGQHDGKKN